MTTALFVPNIRVFKVAAVNMYKPSFSDYMMEYEDGKKNTAFLSEMRQLISFDEADS